MGFHERLQSFGFATYNDYLASERWKAFRERYKESGRSMRCAVCNAAPIQLHHQDYRRVCEELISDVTPVCRKHHEEIHAILKSKNWSVGSTAKVIKILRGTVTQPKQKKKRKKIKRKVTKRKAVAKSIRCIICQKNMTKKGEKVCKQCKREEHRIGFSSAAHIQQARAASESLEAYRRSQQDNPLLLKKPTLVEPTRPIKEQKKAASRNKAIAQIAKKKRLRAEAEKSLEIRSSKEIVLPSSKPIAQKNNIGNWKQFLRERSNKSSG